MGMASSQGRFLALTSRKADITFDLQNLSLQKTSLTRDMQKVTKAYREALNTKTLKFSNNNGITYQELSYNTLMHPNDVNHNTPYLITNTNGRVMIDSNYKKYAELISQNGNPGGDYQSHRAEILSELVGVSAEDLANDKNSAQRVAEAQQRYDYYYKIDPTSNDTMIAKLELDQAKNSNDQIFTKPQESQINFYDRLFTAIVDNGWSYESEIEDAEFLNQSFQNNKYFITTMTPLEEDNTEKYDYKTDIASAVPYIIPVNDKDVEYEAMAEYENAKAVITEKESRIDIRMKNLETEQSAIDNMLKGLESQIKDNIDKNFNVFG